MMVVTWKYSQAKEAFTFYPFILLDNVRDLKVITIIIMHCGCDYNLQT